MLYTYVYNIYITTYLLKMQTYVSRMRVLPIAENEVFSCASQILH